MKKTWRYIRDIHRLAFDDFGIGVLFGAMVASISACAAGELRGLAAIAVQWAAYVGVLIGFIKLDTPTNFELFHAQEIHCNGEVIPAIKPKQ